MVYGLLNSDLTKRDEYNAQKSGLNVVTTGKGVIAPVIVTATSGEFYKKHKVY